MSISIPSVAVTPSAAAVSSSSTAPAPPQPTTEQSTDDSADTVKLSESQQVYQLYNQGQSVSQISNTLSLSESQVNNYLGITSSGS